MKLEYKRSKVTGLVELIPTVVDLIKQRDAEQFPKVRKIVIEFMTIKHHLNEISHAHALAGMKQFKTPPEDFRRYLCDIHRFHCYVDWPNSQLVVQEHWDSMMHKGDVVLIAGPRIESM